MILATVKDGAVKALCSYTVFATAGRVCRQFTPPPAFPV